jgi:hypothetical protein
MPWMSGCIDSFAQVEPGFSSWMMTGLEAHQLTESEEEVVGKDAQTLIGGVKHDQCPLQELEHVQVRMLFLETLTQDFGEEDRGCAPCYLEWKTGV